MNEIQPRMLVVGNKTVEADGETFELTILQSMDDGTYTVQAKDEQNEWAFHGTSFTSAAEGILVALEELGAENDEDIEDLAEAERVLADRRTFEIDGEVFDLVTYHNVEEDRFYITVNDIAENSFFYEHGFESVEEAVEQAQEDLNRQGARGFVLGENVYSFPVRRS